MHGIVLLLTVLRAEGAFGSYHAMGNHVFLDDPTLCLLSPVACDPSRDCKSFAYEPTCLDSRIPPSWAHYTGESSLDQEYTYHAKIACCFQCCLDYMVHLYSIDNTPYLLNESNGNPIYNDHFRTGSEIDEKGDLLAGKINVPVPPRPKKKALQSKKPIEKMAMPRVSSPLWSVSTITKIAKRINRKGRENMIGRGGISKIGALLTPEKDVWGDIKGRRMVEIAANLQCVTRDVLSGALKRPSDFGNVGCVQLFSQQLPCKYGRYLKNRKQAEINGIVTHLNFIKSRFQLIPTGTRDTIAFEEALRRLSGSKAAGHSRTLDCTCASHYKEGRALIEHLYHMNTDSEQVFQCSVNGKLLPKSGAILLPKGYDAEKERKYYTELYADRSINVSHASFTGHYDEKVSYYENLASYQYALSPSSYSFLSPCEWEALAVGVIPIIKYPLDIYDMHTTKADITADQYQNDPNSASWRVFKPSVDNLYQNIPIYKVNAWSKVYLSDTSLRGKYEELKSQFSKPPYSVAKTYIYPALHSINNFLLTSKPSSRFFTRDHVEMKRFKAPNMQCSFGDNFRDRGSPLKSKGKFNADDDDSERNQKLPLNKKRLNKLVARNDSVIKSPRPALRSQRRTNQRGRGLLSESRMSYRRDAPVLELVVPRCCEDGFEFQWLFDFVRQMNPNIGVSIYYKCPQCLPASLAEAWIDGVISTNPLLLKRVKRGYYLLEDDIFVNAAAQRYLFEGFVQLNA